MKIAIVGPYYRPLMSGIEKIMDMQAQSLRDRGHEVSVFTSNLNFPHGVFDVPDIEYINGVCVNRLPVLLRRPPFPFSYPSNGGLIIRKLYGALKIFSPHIVHAHNIGAPAWANISARYSTNNNIPFFYSSYHHPDSLKIDAVRRIFLKKLNKAPLASAKRIYHLTKLDFQKFLVDYPDTPENRFSVLSAGVSPPRSEFAGNESSTSLLFVGRVDDARKGFSVLEKAYDLLLAKRAATLPVLVVVGVVSEETKRRLSDKYGDAIELVGVVEEAELERRYATAGLFVMPSFYEGFGMPYIEAMRYGVPVIGTKVGGIPEVVPEGTGVLVAPGEPIMLAEAIERIIDTPLLGRQLGERGRRWSENFHWPRIIDQLENDYLQAMT